MAQGVCSLLVSHGMCVGKEVNSAVTDVCTNQPSVSALLRRYVSELCGTIQHPAYPL